MPAKTSSIKYFPQILTFAFFAFFLKYALGIKIKGKEKLNASRRPVIIVANHSSKLDPFVVLSAMGWRYFLRFYPWKFPLAKDYAQKWWLGKPAALVGCYKIEGRGDLNESLKETFSCIDNGFSLIFFPEGRMVRKGEISKIKRGIGYVCEKKDVDILPIKIKHNDFDTKGRERIRNSEVVFGETFSSRELREKHPPEELHEIVMERVYALGRVEFISKIS